MSGSDSPSIIGPLAKIVPSLLKSYSAFSEAGAYKDWGQAQKRAADYQATGIEQRAGQEEAVGQRAMLGQAKKGKLVQSALRARAAASGAGGSPDVVDLSADITAETEYRKQVALSDSQTNAQNLRNYASGVRYGGAEAQRAGKIRSNAAKLRGYGSLVTAEGVEAAGKGVGSLWDKYGERDYNDLGHAVGDSYGGTNPGI